MKSYEVRMEMIGLMDNLTRSVPGERLAFIAFEQADNGVLRLKSETYDVLRA